MMKQYLIDTNGLLRFLLNDVPAQADSINTHLKQAKSGAVTITVPLFVFPELEFALRKFYRFKKEEIVQKLGYVVDLVYLDIEKPDILRKALLFYRDHAVSFVDTIFLAEAAISGKELLTFDAKLKKTFTDVSDDGSV